MKKYIAEILGTFALVFAGTGAVIINDVNPGSVTHVGIALTFGMIVMAMIYSLGDVSGAHLNPAVTLGFYLSGKITSPAVIWGYVICQVVGALIASTSLLILFGNHAHLGATLPYGSALQSFGLEFFLTGILMFVILCVSTGSKETGIMAGAAIGGVIALEALFAGPISGASMNPARSLAPAIVSNMHTSLWVYLTAPFLGSAAAVPCWKLMRSK